MRAVKIESHAVVIQSRLDQGSPRSEFEPLDIDFISQTLLVKKKLHIPTMALESKVSLEKFCSGDLFAYKTKGVVALFSRI